MTTRRANSKPREARSTSAASDGSAIARLPTGAHGLTPSRSNSISAKRLRSAMIELIAERGYHRGADPRSHAARARLAPRRFYNLFADKERAAC